MQVQQYNFKVEYAPAKTNAVADMLSRPPRPEEQHTTTCVCSFFIDVLRKNCNQIRSEQIKDDYLLEIVKCLEQNGENRGYILNDGILYCYNNDEDAQLVVPSHERAEILKNHHDNATAGYVKSCIECQRYKASNTKPIGLMQTTSSKQKLEILSIDLFGPFPQTQEGFKWILIAEDVASRWIKIFPLVEATAENCAKLLIDEIFLRYGLPRRLKSDNGV